MNELTEFEDAEIQTQYEATQTWWMWLDYLCGRFLGFLAKLIWKIVSWAWKKCRKMVSQFLRSLWRDLGRMRRKFLEALAEAIGKRIGWFAGILLVIGFTMLFTANQFSISKTFSWDGVVVLWETFQ